MDLSRPTTAARRFGSPRPRPDALVASLLVVATLCAGCTRTHYRLQADREVTQLLNEKNLPGRWGIPNFRLQYDPRSRYFDPTNPDHPPMPPDDPFSHRFMHEVDGKRGARNYHVDGDLEELQNPRWRELIGTYADMTDDGTIRLTLDGAVQLAVIHEPDYREQLEELYLSALDVSTERFRFDTQFFGGINTLYSHLSKNAPGAGGNSSDALAVVDNLQARRRFAAGGELLVGFANSLVWQFAGSDTSSNASLINFSFVQPLLRAGGRRFILEQLTIVERALLANLRAFERYRQGFYTNLAIGDGGTPGPQRRGGFFGGTGLTGFSGQGSGGFGEVGNATGFGGRTNTGGNNGGAVTGGFAGGGAGTLGGFVGLLQQTQQIRNQRQNLNSQLRTLKLLQANLEAGTIDIAQVDQFRQNIETGRATLLQAEIARDNSLETYKRANLGLPPDLPMELDDAMIRQFQFIAPKTNDLYERAENFVDELGNLPPEPDVDVLRMALDFFDRLRTETATNLQAVQADLETMRERRSDRVRSMTAEEAALFDADLKKTFTSFAELERVFADSAAEARALRAELAPTTRKQTIDRLVVAAAALAALVQESSLVQVRARVESVSLEPIVLEPAFALEIARANRLDWMNNRAALVDTWRLIAFNARALLSTLNLTFDGSLGTRGDNPLKFRSTTGTFRAGLQFDAPFTRLLERNNYRAVLIDYQRDRRQLIQFEDSVNQTLRQTLRTLKQLEVNLEIQRRAVIIAARRVDQTREVLNKPPEPVQPGAAAAGLGPTSALNLLTALNDLQSTQNNFMSVWLNHYAARMVLMRELGLMELDDRGLWIDRPLSLLVDAVELDEPEPLPPAVPQEWFEELDRQIRTEAAGPANRSQPNGAASAPGGSNELPEPPQASRRRAVGDRNAADEPEPPKPAAPGPLRQPAPMPTLPHPDSGRPVPQQGRRRSEATAAHTPEHGTRPKGWIASHAQPTPKPPEPPNLPPEPVGPKPGATARELFGLPPVP